MANLRVDKITSTETFEKTGSVQFDGSGDYLSLAVSSDFQFGSGDFTIECWALAFDEGTDDILGIYNTGDNRRTFALRKDQTESMQFLFSSSGTGGTSIASADGIISLNTWHHYAVIRKDLEYTIYLDGKKVGSRYDSSAIYTNTNDGLRIGSSYNTNFQGYISNLRILKGTALYTSDFTVPTHALEVIGDTVLLCCNNSDTNGNAGDPAAGAEATGKTIVVGGLDIRASTFSPGLTRDFTGGTEFSGVTVFDTQGYFVPPSGTTEQRGRGRGLIGGAAVPGTGGTGTGSNSIEYITISSLGNAQDFGDLTDNRRGLGACASSTRGIFGGGYKDSGGYKKNIDFITISSSSNAINFGDLTDDRFGVGAVSNNTRGVFGGGEDSPARHNILDFVTIATLGNAQDFGDLSGTQSNYATVNSSTRGVFAGGSPMTNAIQFITITTTGDAQDFGDLSVTTTGNAGVSSPTRGVIAFGQDPALINNIEFITIATLGNAQDFGDTTVSRTQMGETSNSVRGVFIGGRTDTPTPAVAENTMDYVTIASTGNAQDFGDLIVSRQQSAGLSDSHGGLG